MATKSGLISAINGFITSIVTVTKVRSAYLELINEIFPTTLTSVSSSGGISWNLKFTKSGNNCHVTGTITNTNTFMVGNTKLLDIPNSIYYPKVSQLASVVGVTSLNNGRISFNDATFISAPNAIFILTNIGAGNIVIINQNYIVND